MAESAVRIENRAQLVHLLSEAAELEHGLSCCYLFAAFSLKSRVAEGITEEQAKATKGWKRAITGVAIDEMFHLAHVSNLLTSIGAAPHLRRPNLPASPNMYPEGFSLSLEPFSEETIKRFVFIERPEGQEPRATRRAHPLDRPIDIFPGGQDYETVGHLYRGIEDGFAYLNEKYGAESLFVGLTRSQTSEYDIEAVEDMAGVSKAIDEIVAQGEGARGDLEDSHYGRFSRVQAEYEALKRDDPSFNPARLVVSNPYTRRPGDVAPQLEISIVDDAMSVAVCNLFDGCYELLVQMLSRLFGHTDEPDAELRALAEVTRGMMGRVLSPLGELITTMPAGQNHPDRTAGPSFQMLKDSHAFPHRGPAWHIFLERLRELSAYCFMLDAYENAPASLTQISKAIDHIVEQIPESAFS